MYSLSPYLVQIVANNKKLNLNLLKAAASNEAFSFFDFFAKVAIANEKIGIIQAPGDKRVFRYSSPMKNPDGSVSVQIESGEFGYAQEFVEIQTKAISYTKTKNEAGLTPFFVRVAASNKPDQAILICQKFRTSGIKSHLHEMLGSELAKIDKSWSIRIEKIVPAKLINKYLNDGIVKSIRLISHEKPSDIAEELSKVADDKSSSTVELVVRARRGKSFGADILGFMKQNKPITGIVTLPGMHYDTVKADVDIGGKRKTLNLTNMHKIGASIDVTDQLEYGADGHPTLISLMSETGDLIEDLKRDLS